MAFRKKETTSEDVFVLTVPLHIERWQRDKLDTLFRCCNDMKNALIADRKKALVQMERTRVYRAIQDEIGSIYAIPDAQRTKEQKARLSELYAQRTEILKRYQLYDRNDFYAVSKRFRNHYGKLIHSQVAQKIAFDVCDAFETYFFGNGKEIHFSKWTEFTSIAGASNATGIRYRDGYLLVNQMKLKIAFSRKDRYGYETEAMTRDIHFCGISRRWYSEGWRYFAQLTLSGKPPIKVYPETGELLHPLGEGRVGNDIGPQTLAIVGDTSASLVVLADGIDTQQAELRRLNRAMDRSRRATNPEFFGKDGQVILKYKLDASLLDKRGNRRWVKSKRYRELESKRRALYQRQAERRVQQHHELANRLLAFGDTHFIEKMDFSALAKKAKEPKKNANGKNLSRKRFGKSIANRAPALFVKTYERKVLAAGGAFHQVPTRATKASQYLHDRKTFKKKKLYQRWNRMADGRRVQRDLYSAFLLKHTNDTFNGFNQQALEADYPSFLILHDAEIRRLKAQTHLPSSMGIRPVA